MLAIIDLMEARSILTPGVADEVRTKGRHHRHWSVCSVQVIRLDCHGRLTSVGNTLRPFDEAAACSGWLVMRNLGKSAVA